MWFLYIAQCNDGSFYTGIAQNYEERIQRHNQGKGSLYTKQRRPICLRYVEKFESKAEASLREIQVKKLGRTRKDHLIRFGLGSKFPSSQSKS